MRSENRRRASSLHTANMIPAQAVYYAPQRTFVAEARQSCALCWTRTASSNALGRVWQGADDSGTRAR